MYFPTTSPSHTSYMTTTPLSIPSRSPTNSTTTAYPSWPRRSSLSSPTSSTSSSYSAEESFHNHSFIISDEELFSDVFDESSPSSRASSRENTPIASPKYVVESGSLMREVVRAEKAARAREGRRKTESKGKKSSSSSSRRKSSSGSKKMGTIMEASICE